MSQGAHLPAAPRSFARDLSLFLVSVLVGSVAGVFSRSVSLQWVTPATAGTIAVAIGTTFTGATHARLVHRLRFGPLAAKVTVGAPLAYLVMQAIHAALGA